MNRETMLQLLDRGMSPIDVSIMKWEEIVSLYEVDDVYIDIGPKTCALCETVQDKENCADCPYTVYLGRDCMDGAFNDFLYALDRESGLKAAKAMVLELETLKNLHNKD